MQDLTDSLKDELSVELASSEANSFGSSHKDRNPVSLRRMPVSNVASLTVPHRFLAKNPMNTVRLGQQCPHYSTEADTK